MTDRASFWQRLWTPLVASPLGSAVVRHLSQPLDRALLQLTRGRVTASQLLYPTLLLTTIGAKSGQPRDTPLIFFRDGARIVLIGSNYGGTRHPGWYHNLRANPYALVTLGGSTRPCLAREVLGAEREELWRRAVAYYPGFAVYQRRAGERLIPIIVLE